MANAKLGQIIATLANTVKKLDQRDTAAFTRVTLQEAKANGSVELAHALRGVLKQGRRYKAPRVTAALEDEGHLLADPADIQHALEEAFAKPEHGRSASVQQVAVCCSHEDRPQLVDLHALPSVAGLAAAFLRQKPNKAAGLSSFPAELYAASAIDAAILHAPLLLKAAATGTFPLLWRGPQAIALPKPGKPPGTVAAWRNIALYDAAAKGVGKTLRTQLAVFLRTATAEGQKGSVPGDTLALPAQHIQAYFSCASKNDRSGAVFGPGRG